MKHIGLKIKQLIETKDIHFSQVMKCLGYQSRKAVYDLYEKQHVNTEILEKLSNFFDIPLQYFIEDDNILVTPKAEEKVNIDNNKETLFTKTITNLEEQVNDLKQDKQKLYDQLAFYQNLLANKFSEVTNLSTQMGELKTLLMTREMSNSSVGKWAEIEDSQPTFGVLKGEGTVKSISVAPLFKVS